MEDLLEMLILYHIKAINRMKNYTHKGKWKPNLSGLPRRVYHTPCNRCLHLGHSCKICKRYQSMLDNLNSATNCKLFSQVCFCNFQISNIHNIKQGKHILLWFSKETWSSIDVKVKKSLPYIIRHINSMYESKTSLIQPLNHKTWDNLGWDLQDS